MLCKQCNIEFKAKRKDALFCSVKCKKAGQRARIKGTKQAELKGTTPYEIIRDKKVYKRTAVKYNNDKYRSRPMPDHNEDIPDPSNRCIYQRADATLYIVDATGISINFQDNPLRDNTAQDLYNAINNYEADTWKNSTEFKELMRRLKTMSIVKLIDQGYKIPNWKYKEGYKQLVKHRRVKEQQGGNVGVKV